MSKLPLWLPPGFALGDPRRIPVLRIVGVEEGSPQAAELAERFAGSLRQFFVAQGRNQALGIAPQRNVRVDRGDHQIEYLNQFGQEVVTLHVHPSVMPVPVEKVEGFVPMEFLEIRILGEALPADQPDSAAYNVMFYAQGLYDADTAPTDTAIGDPYYELPNGVAVAGGLTALAYNTHIFDATSDPVVSNARLAWLDLRGFSPDAVVGVDIYVYHAETYDAEEQTVGSQIAATAAWQNGPDAAPFTPNSIRRYHDSDDWIASVGRIQTDFPEYADLPMTSDSGFGFNYITTPLAKHGVLKYGTYIGSTGGYLGNPPPRNAIGTARGGGYGKILETWPGTNHLPYSVSYGDVEYYPGTSFPRKQPYYYFYNSYTGDDTDLSDPPSAPSWDPAGGSNYDYSCEIGVGYVLYTTILDLVSPPRPLQFDIWALGRMGGERPREVLFPPPDPPQPPDIGADELPLVAEDIQVAANLQTDAERIAGFTVANHFNGIHIGTVYADRKRHAVAFVPARP